MLAFAQLSLSQQSLQYSNSAYVNKLDNLNGSFAGGGAFTGQSRTLAGGPAETPAATPSAPAASSSQPIVHTITFYSNGVFTVNEGER